MNTAEGSSESATLSAHRRRRRPSHQRGARRLPGVNVVGVPGSDRPATRLGQCLGSTSLKSVARLDSPHTSETGVMAASASHCCSLDGME